MLTLICAFAALYAYMIAALAVAIIFDLPIEVDEKKAGRGQPPRK